jgi:hypothetical protein
MTAPFLFLCSRRNEMAKATQPKHSVPTRVAALSVSYFDGVPSRAKFEDIEERVLGGFGRYATLSADSKTTASEKRELKEKMTPWLRALRTQLNAKGRKGEGWQRWCEGHKAAIGGISRKTADRWLDGPQEEKKYANLDNADGLKLNGKKYSYKLVVENDRITRIDVTPIEEPETATVTKKVAEPVAKKKLDAASTRNAMDKFFRAYKREHKDDVSSKYMEGYLAALTAEYEKHSEWLKQTVDANFQKVRTAIYARGRQEEDQTGWTRVGKNRWTHEDGRKIQKTGDSYYTFDADDVTICPTSTLLDAMRAKRELHPAAEELQETLNNLGPTPTQENCPPKAAQQEEAL